MNAIRINLVTDMMYFKSMVTSMHCMCALPTSNVHSLASLQLKMTLQVDCNIYMAFCGNQLKLSCDVNNVLLILCRLT